MVKKTRPRGPYQSPLFHRLAATRTRATCSVASMGPIAHQIDPHRRGAQRSDAKGDRTSLRPQLPQRRLKQMVAVNCLGQLHDPTLNATHSLAHPSLYHPLNRRGGGGLGHGQPTCDAYHRITVNPRATCTTEKCIAKEGHNHSRQDNHASFWRTQLSIHGPKLSISTPHPAPAQHPRSQRPEPVHTSCREWSSLVDPNKP